MRGGGGGGGRLKRGLSSQGADNSRCNCLVIWPNRDYSLSCVSDTEQHLPSFPLMQIGTIAYKEQGIEVCSQYLAKVLIAGRLLADMAKHRPFTFHSLKHRTAFTFNSPVSLRCNSTRWGAESGACSQHARCRQQEVTAG